MRRAHDAMRRGAMRRGALAAALIAAAGCTEARTGSEPAGGAETTSQSAPMSARPASRALPPALGADELLLDADGRRFVVARALPAPENADPPLRVQARVWRDGAWQATPLDSEVVEFVGLVGDDELVVVASDGRLDWVGASGEAITLARPQGEARVEGAVAVSADGRHLAFAYGAAPALEIHRVSRAEGRVAAWTAPVSVTRGQAPAWSPALSADGAELAFVSAARGVPEWWIARRGEAPRLLLADAAAPPPELDALGPFAASISAPRLVSADGAPMLLFEGEDGAHTMALDGTRRWSGAAWRTPFVVQGADGRAAQFGARHRDTGEIAWLPALDASRRTP